VSSNYNGANTMKFLTPPVGMTEAGIDLGIEEAFAQAVRNGLLVLTGKTQWSERKQCMMPIYMRAPSTRERH
jgi:hypothetical protein